MMTSLKRYGRAHPAAAALLATLVALSDMAASDAVKVMVDPDRVLRDHDRSRLLGTNVGLWYRPEDLAGASLIERLKAWGPGSIRIPGGSWSNAYYWNGHGVREGSAIDSSKLRDGVWDVDFSDYAPGFRIQGVDRTPSDYHGAVDVLALHEFARTIGAPVQVSVNAGTGTPEMAAEWVRWANKKMGFGVTYWEVGNELEGDWELGNLLPDGTRMTGPLYARRFLEFAKAMKAVDPTIKVGGPVSSSKALAFGEDLIREAGDHLDFFSYHTYPVEKAGATTQDAMDEAKNVGKSVQKIREWIEKYHPDRKDKIEIGITEWHYKVVEDEETVSMVTALWSAVFIGEVFKAGVDFANQWDLFSKTADGGHCMFLSKEEMQPTAQYWAFYLWKTHMQDRLIPAVVSGTSESLWSIATRSEDRISVMLVNSDASQDAGVSVQIPGMRAMQAQRISFTGAEYAWDPISKKPAWSRPPRVEPLEAGDPLRTVVPPMSIQILEFRTQGAAFEKAPREVAGSPQIEVRLPASSPVDLPVCGVVLVRDASRGGGSLNVPEVSLAVEGPAELMEKTVRTTEGIARFTLKLKEPGEVAVTARAGDVSARATMKSLKVEQRDQVVWHFDGSPDAWGLKSTYALQASDQERPNQNVAMVVLDEAVPAQNNDLILHVDSLPKDLARERIGGVVFKIKRSASFASADPSAAVGVVLQSESNHWIPLGRVALSDIQEDWKEIRLAFKEPGHILAMPNLYSLRLQLVSSAPVSGKLYIDDLGFILRASESN